MSKKRGKLKTTIICLACIVVGGGISYGVVKTVEYFQKPTEEQSEQTPEDEETYTTSIEEQIANENIANF